MCHEEDAWIQECKQRWDAREKGWNKIMKAWAEARAAREKGWREREEEWEEAWKEREKWHGKSYECLVALGI